MRAPRLFVLMLTALALMLACRQPSAELQLSEPRAVEPSGLDSPSVFVEAPRVVASGPLLDWTQVDDRLAGLVDGERLRVDYDDRHPWVGADVPLVTIVVFGDYECPFCGRLDETFNELLRDYPNRLRVVYRQFPLSMHANARLMAGVALAAHTRGQFEAMHRWLYTNRRVDRQAILTFAASLGLDAQAMFDEVDAGYYDSLIDDDMQLAKHFEVSSTPTYFINGRMASGSRPRADIESTIAEELALAERMIAAGSAPEQVWARIMAASAPAPQATAKIPDKRWATQLAGLPRRGPSTAKVEILMCADFDCPYCQRSVATLEQLLIDHPNDVAIFFRNHPLPMHKNARAAHRAAVAADNQGQFWAMFELLYADSDKRSDKQLEAMAKQLGLSLSRFRSDVADAKTDARIDAELAYCQQDLDASGTPTFFINGRKLVGAQPVSAFEAIIQEELSGRGPP